MDKLLLLKASKNYSLELLYEKLKDLIDSKASNNRVEFLFKKTIHKRVLSDWFVKQMH